MITGAFCFLHTISFGFQLNWSIYLVNKDSKFYQKSIHLIDWCWWFRNIYNSEYMHTELMHINFLMRKKKNRFLYVCNAFKLFLKNKNFGIVKYEMFTYDRLIRLNDSNKPTIWNGILIFQQITDKGKSFMSYCYLLWMICCCYLLQRQSIRWHMLNENKI